MRGVAFLRVREAVLRVREAVPPDRAAVLPAGLDISGVLQ
jgi:hypothetical protein